MAHRHRPDGRDEAPDGRVYATLPYYGCVRPDRCNPAAHGGWVYEEQCACGWARRAVLGVGHREVSPWQTNRVLYEPL